MLVASRLRTMLFPSERLLSLACLVSSFNIVVSLLLVRIYHQDSSAHAEIYTYVGNSYPSSWEPPGVARSVEMTFSESNAYPLSGPLADEAWESTRAMSTHKGYVHLGPDKRWFALSMFHQLHCVNTFRKALLDPVDGWQNEHHVQHCLSYLRQLFLCAADDTLEPGDFVQRDYNTERMGITRTCRDWSVVYDAAEDNWVGWMDFYSDHSRQIQSGHTR